MLLAAHPYMDVNALASALGSVEAPAVDWGVLLGGLALIALALVVIFVLKRIVVNSILGIVALIVVKFLLGVDLPLIPTLIVSVLFGLAGIGTMLVLHFLGLL